MDKFEKICKDIKEVKIQGAENIARAAARAMLLKHDKQSIKKLMSLRPTEPCLRNTIKFVLMHKDINEGVSKALEHFDNSKKRIAQIGSRIIEDNSTIFVHCHSSAVLDILKEAKERGKKFHVYSTETRPLFQGRITAKELAKMNIKVTHIIDSAARIALKKSDLMLIGCDAITTTRIYNKVGSEMFAIIAKKYNIPVYVATDSWKFDPKSIFGIKEKIEERNPKEIWQNAPKGIEINNYAFEAIDPMLVDGIISELGLFMDKSFIEEVKKNYPMLF